MDLTKPFKYFMKLSVGVKITLIICFTVLLLAFMYFSVQTETFDDVLRWFIDIDSEAKK